MINQPEIFGVLLIDAGKSKIPVIKVIRSELRLGLKEAKALADAGGVVADGLTLDAAQRLVEKLLAAGARAEIHGRTSPQSGGWDSPPSLTTSPQTSIADEIQKLVALRNSGVLTEAEFEAAKRRVLYL